MTFSARSGRSRFRRLSDIAARKLVEIANGVEAVMDGRIYIERVNAPFLAAGGTGKDFRAGIEVAGRRMRPELVDSETALAYAKDLARGEQHALNQARLG